MTSPPGYWIMVQEQRSDGNRGPRHELLMYICSHCGCLIPKPCLISEDKAYCYRCYKEYLENL